jgi:crotonobetainyl-CoA:carnitine CoA-transferase CaiB-like acyl-CoA transferase
MNSLDGIRVLDLSRVLAGPWCTQTLADLGADVIKIERPFVGDDTRHWGPPFSRQAQGEAPGDAAYFLSANRNKRSVCCDIATPEGQALVRRLVQQSQVLVENFKVGDLARYGLDYESLHALNPALVYCSVTGFGQTGPYRERAGYDYAVQGMGGLMSVTGERDDLGGGPQKVGVAVADLFTGMYACVGILAALRHAERTGQGQHIDLALLDTQVAMLANVGAAHLLNGQVPGRAGNAHAHIAPYQVFEVKPPHDTPDASPVRDHLILAVGNDNQFVKLCAVAGCPQLAQDPRFAHNAGRVQHRAALLALLQPLFLARTKADWMTALNAVHVPCGPINHLGEVFADPQVQARGMVQDWPRMSALTDQLGTCDAVASDALKLVASPLKLSQTPVQQSQRPPLRGQHTREVLSQLLGLDDAAQAALRQMGAIE